ncbi:hypothetical protein F0U59_16400 [Archangium gephyra]|nr:hypothetical protein F0U59_16400 [Archangium gephyra]
MWEAIRYVGTPLTLVAFIVAALAYAYRLRAARLKALVDTLPEKHRARILEGALRDFAVVETASLSAKQKHDLAVRSLEQRERTWNAVLRTALVAFVILTATVVALSAFAFWRGGQPVTITQYDPLILFNRVTLKKPAEWFLESNSEMGVTKVIRSSKSDVWTSITYGMQLQDAEALECERIATLFVGEAGDGDDGHAPLSRCKELDNQERVSLALEIPESGTAPAFTFICGAEGNFERHERTCHTILSSVRRYWPSAANH